MSLNRYYGWYFYPHLYEDLGYLGNIEFLLSTEIETWYDIHRKPVLLTEYGADAVMGMRQVSEELGLGIVLVGPARHTISHWSLGVTHKVLLLHHGIKHHDNTSSM